MLKQNRSVRKGVGRVGGTGVNAAMAIGLAWGWAVPALAQPAEYTVIDLGIPADGAYNVIPRGLNNLGEVVGWSATSFATPPTRAWKWTPTNGLVVLPTPPGSSGFGAFDITDTGVIVGGGATSFSGIAWRFQNGSYTFLDLLPGSDWSAVTGMNADGEVAGYSDEFSSGGSTQDWFFESEQTGLMMIAPDAWITIGRINDARQVVGGMGYDAVVWSPSAGFTTLGDPPGLTCTAATAINNLGQVAGRASERCGGNPGEKVAWLYTPGVGWEIIVDLVVGGGPDNRLEVPAAINNRGEVIGTTDYLGGIPWVWSRERGARVLNDVVDRTSLPEHFWIYEALDINDHGQIVAMGVSLTGGTYGAFLLTPIPAECPSDFNRDGFVTGDDFDQFVVVFVAGSLAADFNGDGFVTGDDFDAFVIAFEAGC